MDEIEQELSTDLGMLETAESSGISAFRTWTSKRTCVVLGISQSSEAEADAAYCRANEILVVKRSSGGGAVLVGPGTLQYAFALPYSLAPELNSIASSKSWCNALVAEALNTLRPAPGPPVCSNAWGDLVIGQHKIAGTAMRRRRCAMLLHGTLLLDANLREIELALHHPSKEPEYRRGRSHAQFVTNFGRIDRREFEKLLSERLAVIARESSNA